MVSTKLVSLYDELEKANVQVQYVPFLKEHEAISFLSDTNTFWIGLNHDLIKSERTELCVLLEEQAHYEVGIIPNDYSSNSYSDILARQKNELKAKKWAVKKMISRDKLFEYIKNTDYIDVEELADYFEVIPQFMKEALIIYGII